MKGDRDSMGRMHTLHNLLKFKVKRKQVLNMQEKYTQQFAATRET